MANALAWAGSAWAGYVDGAILANGQGGQANKAVAMGTRNAWVDLGPRQRNRIKAAVYANKGQLCWRCGGVADTVDHIIPVSKGGTHDLANLRPACMPCNRKRSNRLDPVYLAPSRAW